MEDADVHVVEVPILPVVAHADEPIPALVDQPVMDDVVHAGMLHQRDDEADGIGPGSGEVQGVHDPVAVGVVVTLARLVGGVAEPSVGRPTTARPQGVYLVTEPSQGRGEPGSRRRVRPEWLHKSTMYRCSNHAV